MNILVTGANGQLGNEMRVLDSQLSALNPQLNFIFTDVNQVEGLETTYLDITDIDAIRKMVKDNDVTAIVNCAAWTNVDACENDEKLAALAEKLNADAPENLAIAMKEVGGLLIHISTDYVFGKEPYNIPCNPDQKGTPTGVYGATKLLGEQKIKAVFDSSSHSGETEGDYIILRTAWLYSEFGKNFCKTMLNLTATKPALKVVFDQCGTPTYAYDLAAAIVHIIKDYEQEYNSRLSSLDSQPSSLNSRLSTLDSRLSSHYSKTGIYHYSNEGVTSWYDFTKMIQRIAVTLETPETLETFGTHGDCDIQPCYSSEYPSPVTRPAYSVLDKRTFREAFNITIPYWVDSLEKCIRNILK